MRNNQLTLFGEEKNRCAYEEAVTKFIEEYMEMPPIWYVTRNNKKVLSPLFVHVAICFMIAHELFTLEEVKKEFYNEYGMILYYNTDDFEYY